MAPASETHNIIQGELGALIRNHLVAMGRRSTLVPNAGIVPHVPSDSNVRIPDLAVTCASSRQESQSTSDPVLLVEIPERPEVLEDGTLELQSIGASPYAGSRFDRELLA